MTDEADETGQSDEEIMQGLYPGSTMFKPHILCPCCGWHFKRGLTDPSGEVVAMVPGILLVCGECLRLLLSNEQLQFEALDNAQINALPVEARIAAAKQWQLAFVSLALRGQEPKGTMQ